MAQFLFTYTGGSAPTSPEEGAKVMAIWVDWFKGLGTGTIDMGNPTGPSKSVTPGGAVADAPSGPTGYSIIGADSLDAAVAIAKTCPVLHAGGTVIVSAVQDMM
ncbi:MAG: hypothetical protein U0869_05650 [Chloroflexota bacterium]